jgi:hypothetical protein
VHRYHDTATRNSRPRSMKGASHLTSHLATNLHTLCAAFHVDISRAIFVSYNQAD